MLAACRPKRIGTLIDTGKRMSPAGSSSHGRCPAAGALRRLVVPPSPTHDADPVAPPVPGRSRRARRRLRWFPVASPTCWRRKPPPCPTCPTGTACARQFALDPAYAHFASFFIASHPAPVRDAIEGWRRAMDRNPFLTIEHGMFEDDAHNMPLQVQSAIAEYLGGQRAGRRLTRSTTEGLALVYHGLPLKAGDEVLTTCTTTTRTTSRSAWPRARAGATMRKIALFDEAAAATTDSIIERLLQGGEPEDARGRPDLGAFQQRHPPADPRDRRGAEGEASRRAAGGRRRARHRRGRRDHRHDGRRLLLRRLPQVDVRAARHRPGLGQRRNWARLRPTMPNFSDLESYNAWARGPRAAPRPTTPRA